MPDSWEVVSQTRRGHALWFDRDSGLYYLAWNDGNIRELRLYIIEVTRGHTGKAFFCGNRHLEQKIVRHSRKHKPDAVHTIHARQCLPWMQAGQFKQLREFPLVWFMGILL